MLFSSCCPGPVNILSVCLSDSQPVHYHYTTEYFNNSLMDCHLNLSRDDWRNRTDSSDGLIPWLTVLHHCEVDIHGHHWYVFAATEFIAIAIWHHEVIVVIRVDQLLGWNEDPSHSMYLFTSASFICVKCALALVINENSHWVANLSLSIKVN